MTPDDVKLVQEHSRYKMALQSILALCRNATFGGWRFKIGAIACRALGEDF